MVIIPSRTPSEPGVNRTVKVVLEPAERIVTTGSVTVKSAASSPLTSIIGVPFRTGSLAPVFLM